MEFAVDLESVAVVDQTLEMVVHVLERGLRRDPLVCCIRRQAVLPHLVDAFDLPLRLGRVREDERDVQELQPLRQPGKASIVVPEEGRLVHVYLEREAVPRESPVKQVQIRGNVLAAVQPAADLHATAVVNHVDEAERRVAPSEEVVRRRVELPELSDALALPAPYVRGRPRPRGFGIHPVLERPVPDLGAIHDEAELPLRLAGGEGIRVSPGSVPWRQD